MIDHTVHRYVTLRTPSGAKAPPTSRTLGDPPAWNDAGAEIRPEGEGRWRSEGPLESAPFLQAMAQWKIEGPSALGARPLPARHEHPSSLD